MGESSAKAMIDRFRHQRPMSREERRREGNELKEMWWINPSSSSSIPQNKEEGDEEVFKSVKPPKSNYNPIKKEDREDLEHPRSSPVLAPSSPPQQRKMMMRKKENENQEPPLPSSSSSFHLQKSDESFLARLGLSQYTDKNRNEEKEDCQRKDFKESEDFLKPKKSSEFDYLSNRDENHRSHHSQHRLSHDGKSIDDFITSDIRLSSSIDRLLNEYPKTGKSIRPLRRTLDDADEKDHRRRNEASGSLQFRFRSSFPREESEGGVRKRHSWLESSLDLGGSESETLKGLLLPLKLDGEANKGDANDAHHHKEMSDNIQAIIASLACLDRNEGEEKGFLKTADHIHEVYSALHAEMQTFASLYGDKYEAEERAEEERRKRDEEMREEGRREQLRKLGTSLFPDAFRSDEESEEERGEEEVKEDVHDLNFQNASTSFLPSRGGNKHGNKKSGKGKKSGGEEARVRAAWLGMEDRPVWSSKLGRYVLPSKHDDASPSSSCSSEEKGPSQHEAPGALLVSTGGVSSVFMPNYEMCHGSIHSAAKIAIESCLNVTEQTLRIRLPGDGTDQREGEKVQVDPPEDSPKSPPNCPPNCDPNVTEEEGPVKKETPDAAAPEPSSGYIDSIVRDHPESSAKELEELDRILGEDDDSLGSYLGRNDTFKNEVTPPNPQQARVQLVGRKDTPKDEVIPPILQEENRRHQMARVKFRDLEEIEQAMQSKPTVPSVFPSQASQAYGSRYVPPSSHNLPSPHEQLHPPIREDQTRWGHFRPPQDAIASAPPHFLSNPFKIPSQRGPTERFGHDERPAPQEVFLTGVSLPGEKPRGFSAEGLSRDSSFYDRSLFLQNMKHLRQRMMQ